jgi:hypothetical protein
LLGKVAMWKSGEAGKAVEGGEEEEGHVKQAILVGVDAHTISAAKKLLTADWNVIMYDRNNDKLDRAIKFLENHDKKDEDFSTVFSFEGIQKALEKHSLDNVIASANASPATKKSRKNSASSGGGGSGPSSPALVPVPTSESTTANAGADTTSEHGSDGGESHEAALVGHMLAPGVEIVEAFERESEELLDVRAAHTNVAILHLNNDEEACTLAAYMQSKLHVKRVIVKLNNPVFAPDLAARGIIPLHEHALQSFLLNHLTIDEHGPTASVVPDEEVPFSASVLGMYGATGEDRTTAALARARPDLVGASEAEQYVCV